MSEQHQHEPVLASDILENNFDDVMAFDGDPVREHQVHQLDLEDEQLAIQAEIDDLWSEIQAGRAGEGAQERLEDLRQALLATDADAIDARLNQDGNPPQ